MSKHVRDIFRTALQTAADPLPYVETIAMPHDLRTTPDQWVTLEFPLASSARVSIGYPALFRESGAAIIHLMTRSGGGDDAAMQVAEDIRNFFEAPYLDDVRLLGTYPPALIPVDEGEWIDVTVPINYEWDYLVSGATP
jgi:hypothetical protein